MGVIKQENIVLYDEVYQELLQRREEVKELARRLEVERKAKETLLAKQEIRRWYQGALLREQDNLDPDGFAKEAIEEVVHYLGADGILADISPFCRNKLEEKKKQQSW